MKTLRRSSRLIAAALICTYVLGAAAAEPASEDESLFTLGLDVLSAPAALGLAAASDGVAAVSAELAALEPAVRKTLAPMLSHWIAESRDAAMREGVHPVPRAIRAALAGYVPDEVLDRARWRVDGGGVLSLQQTLFRSGYVPAVTLEHVIVFDRERDAREDAALWAHELKHVMQYAEWGLEGFASRYLEDYAAIEAEASDYRRRWLDLHLAHAEP